jgi:hypothetical protein
MSSSYCRRSRDSSVRVVSRLWAGGSRNLIRFLLGATDYPLSKALIPPLEPSQFPIQCVPGALSPRVKRLEREAKYSRLFRAEVMNTQSYTSIPSYPLVMWYLIKQGENFTATEVISWQ